MINHFKDRSEVPAVTPTAVEMSKGLKRPVFTFVGPDYLLRADAGLGHGHGPHPGLRSLRAAGERRLEWLPRAQQLGSGVTCG